MLLLLGRQGTRLHVFPLAFTKCYIFWIEEKGCRGKGKACREQLNQYDDLQHVRYTDGWSDRLDWPSAVSMKSGMLSAH